MMNASSFFDKNRIRRRLGTCGVYVSFAVFILVVLIPVYWLLMSALTPLNQLFSIPPRYLFQPTLENFSLLVEQVPFFHYLRNSLLFALSTSVLSVAISFLAAYGFARIAVPGRDILLLGLVLSMALPEIVTVVPLFQVLRSLSMINTVQGLTLVMTSVLVPFTVWVLVSFIRQIPVEMEEAAVVDGVTLPQLLWIIVIPVMKPALVTMLAINLINAWNNLVYPLAFSSTIDAKTLSVSVTEVFQARSPFGRPWHLISALGMTMVVPVTALVFLAQKAIVSGLTRGSIK